MGEFVFYTQDKALLQRLDTLKTLAHTDIPILIIGETGTGKELLARHIDQWSRRWGQPFTAVNCAGIVESLFEAELFGNVKGAYTGAYAAREGLLRTTHGGTLFLDEIGDMPMPLQSKLLRVLQDGAVRPVGGVKEVPISIRVVSATNQPLWELVKAKRFRDDLYYRLKGEMVYIPPLRERPDDIIPLAEKLDNQYCQQLWNYDTSHSFLDSAKERLLRRPWLGNVRELQFAVLRARQLAKTMPIWGELIDPDVVEPARKKKPVGERGTLNMEAVQKQTLIEALEATGGNVTHAAKLMGMSLRTVRNWRHRYNLVEYGEGGA